MLLKYIVAFFPFILSSIAYAKIEHSHSPLSLHVTINTVTYNKYQLFSKKDVCNELPDFTKKQVDRPIVELSIICDAFKQQGINLNIEFFETSSYARSLWLVKKGLVDIFAQTVWQEDIDEEYMHASIDLLRVGEFFKGIYTHETHHLLNMEVEHINFGKYRGMTQQTWLHDLAIINSLTKDVLKNNYFPTMFKILSNNRADFTLMEFPAQGELSISQDGHRLKPIKGIKVVIPIPRKFIVSKTSINNQLIFDTLNQGLQALRDKKEIYKTYLDSGFINNKTKNWRVINGHQF